MRLLRQAASPPIPWLVGIAASGLAASVVFPDALQAPAFCGAAEGLTLADLPALPAPGWSLAAAAVAWVTMVAAMMPPLIAQPVRHVWRSSLPRRRPWALLLFAGSYLLVWLAAGVPLVAAGTLLELAAPPSIALALALAVAVLWSFSPGCQIVRNRCHRVHRIGAFGRGADRDCLVYGARVGLPCTGVCWPWMLAATCLHEGHAVAMVSATILLFLDRLAPPAVPSWRSPPVLRQALRAMRPPQKVLGNS